MFITLALVWVTHPVVGLGNMPSLLDKAAIKLGDDVARAWDAAYFLHVNGFHEVRIEIDEVKSRLPVIQSLINVVKEELGL